MGTHQDRKLLTNPLQATQAIVLGQRCQEVRENLILRSTSDFSELLCNLKLIRARERGSVEEADEFRVAFKDPA